MKQRLAFLLIISFFFASFSAVAGGFSELKSKEGITIKYKLKDDKKTKEKILLLKFKNKSGSPAQFETEIGFYQDGILAESSSISTCLKKGICQNWFGKVNSIETAILNAKEELEIKALEMKITPIDECGKDNSE